MPFYEYECASCKFYTEVMQKISDAPLKKCPSCGKSTLKKLISAPVFRLKGGGWYETDFKSDKEDKRNLAGADKDEPKAESRGEAGQATPRPAASRRPRQPARRPQPETQGVQGAPSRAPGRKPPARRKAAPSAPRSARRRAGAPKSRKPRPANGAADEADEARKPASAP